MKKIENELTRQAITIGIIAAVWTIAAAGSLFWNKFIQDQETASFARIQADAVLYKDIVFRDWMTMKGDVYAPVSENTIPNPYLNLPERDVTLSNGKRYTLINPAYMTREVHDLQSAQRHILGHITSLKPIRPKNAPDGWEASVLKDFEKGLTEASVNQVINNIRYFRLMKPLVTDASCLRCHADQGYKVGNIRGGISVSIPLDPLIEASEKHFFAICSAHAGI